jgi:hypothetical protein
MNVLPKSSEVDRLTAESSSVHVEFAGLVRMAGEKQSMD